MEKSSETITKASDGKNFRPSHPRQYRPKKSLLGNPVTKQNCSRNAITEVDPFALVDQILYTSTTAPREELIINLMVKDNLTWGAEVEDFDDLNPYMTDSTQALKSDHNNSDFKRAEIKQEPPDSPFQIKQEPLDIEDVLPNHNFELRGVTTFPLYMKDEPSNHLTEIKQDEIHPSDYDNQFMDDFTDNKQDEICASDNDNQFMERTSYSPVTIKNNQMETIEDDGESYDTKKIDLEPNFDVPNDEMNPITSEPEEIATICIDDTDDEDSNGSAHKGNNGITFVHVMRNEQAKPLQYPDHTCIPRRLYHNNYLKRFVKRKTYRGYSIKVAKLLNRGTNQFTHIYTCDNCDKQCSNHDTIRQHVATHGLKRSANKPHLYVTNECQFCYKRNLDDPCLIREHLDLEHSAEVYKAAKGQRFAVRIECRICPKWFPMNECMECGEEYDQKLGITYHNRIHRRAETSGSVT